MADKIVLLMGDEHCGHLLGLTHPDYQINYSKKIKKVEEELWDKFKSGLKTIEKEFGKIDICISNGDGIDGNGSRSGGTELIQTDPQIQCDMLEKVLEEVNAKTNIMTYGTPYHSGSDTDYEKIVADRIGANIRSEQMVDINGVLFNIKHHIGSSSTPYSRQTAVTKENIWNLVRSENEEIDRADVFIRSHVHYHVFSGDRTKLCMTLPALQASGSKYGERKCSGTVDFGMVVFKIYDKPNKFGGRYEWHQIISPIVTQKTETIVL